MKKILKMAVASSVAAILLVAGAATSANAADQTEIDLDTLGSITVHKYEQPTSDDPLAAGDGTELPTSVTSFFTPLEGVEFTVAPVTGLQPLNSIFGWEQVSNLSVSPAGVVTSSDPDVTPVVGTAGAPLATDDEGTALFSNLPVGVYLVTETAPGPNNIVNEVAPFLVTIPMINPATDAWNYNVHAYPKNSVAAFSKSVEAPNGYGLGAQIAWPHEVTIPVLPAGESIEAFTVTDTLDARLSYVFVSDVLIGGVEVPESDYTVTVNGQAVTVNFTNYAYLTGAQDNPVTFKINTEVVGVGDGTITNVSNVTVNDLNGNTNTAQTLWGSLAIEKVNENGAALAGAQFSIYENIDDANAGTNPVSVNGTSVFTSNAAGEVNVEGLFVGDSTDGESDKVYFVKEVAAPAGYLLLENAIPYVVVAGGIATADISEVENFPIPAGTLPTTGAEGLPLMLGAGALLLAAGVTVYFVTRRKGAKATN